MDGVASNHIHEPHRGRDIKPRLKVAVEVPKPENGNDSGSTSQSASDNTDSESAEQQGGWKLPSSLEWVPANWEWSKIKPVIRCAVVAWLSAVLFIIPQVEVLMGQASFIILIAAILSPPSDPFIAVLEREILILLFASASWAWSCLGMKLAFLARRNRDPSASLLSAITGRYIEAAPSVILAVFIVIGSAVLLFIRARQGPGPYLFACLFGCLCLDICITTAALVPYPYYIIGRAILIPLSFHSALALLSSIVIFPATISAQYTTRLQAVLSPIIKSLEFHQSALKLSPHTPEFKEATNLATKSVSQSESNLIPLGASGRLLSSDLIYGRYAPDDFRVFQDLARRITSRGNGMGMYFSIIDPGRQRFPVTPAPSVPGTPRLSPVPTVGLGGGSGNPSLERVITTDVQDEKLEPPPSPAHGPRSASLPRVHRPLSHSHQHSHSHSHTHVHHRHTHHNLLHQALHSLSHHTHRYENAVGVFESQRYLNLEATRFSDPFAEEYTARMTVLLSESCPDLLDGCRGALVVIRDWLETLRHGRVRYWLKPLDTKAQWKKKLAEHQTVRDNLAAALEHFRDEQRHRIVDPYRPAFESKRDSQVEQDIPAHRYLFHCYVYQYHLIQFSWVVIEMLDEMIRLEKERQSHRLWTPVQRLIRWNNWEISENVEHEGDEDPDLIQGLAPATMDDLGMPRHRDPDALPPRNFFELAMDIVYRSVTGIAGGNVLYAIKAGLFTVLLSLPSLIKSSASFAYGNRFVWAIAMGQLTLARFRGDTTFGFVARVFSTFMGGIVGMVMWYISCGSGSGNPYGLATVCAVCFPFFFFIRLYWPGPPMTNIIFFVTAILVVGYSYQDLHIIVPGSPGFGFSVFWRRFVLVTVGVFAAFIVSFLPPSTTIRRYLRATLSTTSSEIGVIYCAILSYANTRNEEEVHEINASLIALRSKLRRSTVLRTNVIYEFSLRGRWPVERYNALFEIQLQIAYALSHLMSVFKHLEPAWTRALLRRTRFLDTDFQGDILAVITMISSSLRTGSPLPQITPCPLLDRFMLQYHGLDVIHKEAEEDYGLPRTLTLETLQDEQYLFFCVGVSVSFSIMTRLDRLMVAAKEVVGEQYHIHGVGLGPRVDSDFGERAAVHFQV